MTTTAAAILLHIGKRAVVALIKSGRLLATKPGRDYEISADAVLQYQLQQDVYARSETRRAIAQLSAATRRANEAQRIADAVAAALDNVLN